MTTCINCRCMNSLSEGRRLIFFWSCHGDDGERTYFRFIFHLNLLKEFGDMYPFLLHHKNEICAPDALHHIPHENPESSQRYFMIAMQYCLHLVWHLSIINILWLMNQTEEWYEFCVRIPFVHIARNSIDILRSHLRLDSVCECRCQLYLDVNAMIGNVRNSIAVI